jgi:hypothetical protein
VASNHKEQPDAADRPGKDNTVIGKYGLGIIFSDKRWERASLVKSSWDGEDLNPVRLLERGYKYFPL